MSFKKHWPWLLALLLQSEAIWRLVKWALDWRGRYDALAESYHELGGWRIMVGYVLNPPPWVDLLTIVAGALLIWWDLRRNQTKRDLARFVEQQEVYKFADEKEMHEQVSKWLTSSLSEPNLYIRQAFLFGSILHHRYQTSDVDLVVEFASIKDGKLASVVRKLKTDPSKSFETTF